MHVETLDRSIGVLIDQISSGEIRLPKIQREYVWKPTQIAKLTDSIYRGYRSRPCCSDDLLQTPPMAVNSVRGQPILPTAVPAQGTLTVDVAVPGVLESPPSPVRFHVEREASELDRSHQQEPLVGHPVRLA